MISQRPVGVRRKLQWACAGFVLPDQKVAAVCARPPTDRTWFNWTKLNGMEGRPQMLTGIHRLVNP